MNSTIPYCSAELKIEHCAPIFFKQIISAGKEDRKWLMSHLVNNLSDYSLYKISDAHSTAGIFCILLGEISYADIFLLPDFQKKGFGKKLVETLVQYHPIIHFKVNAHNKNSLAFFDALVSKGLVKKHISEGRYFIYRSNYIS